MDLNSKLTLNTGRKIPIMGLGTWELTSDTADVISYALALGYPMIDTSSDYGSQPGIGEGIKKSGETRESFCIVTKVEETDDAYDRVKSNLSELQLEYADLMLIHRPPENGVGEDLWEDLIKAQKEGLVKDIGVSNYRSDQIDKLIEASGITPVVNQIEWTPFGHSDEMKKYCDGKKILIMVYSPLTRETKIDTRLKKMADKYSKTCEQMLIRWNIQQGVIPIPKANEKEHLEEDIDVFNFEITEKDIQLLNSFNEDYSALGSLPYI
jgi:diketogulonate reductase-like aldo/keto reductase